MLDLFDQIIYVAAKAMPNSEPSLQMTLYSSLSLSLSLKTLLRKREMSTLQKIEEHRLVGARSGKQRVPWAMPDMLVLYV